MNGRPSFTCPDCGRTSWNSTDVKYGYCGACHAFTITKSVDRPAASCPYCRAQFDAVTGLTDQATPDPGDAGICFYCAGLLVYDDAGQPREPTDAELERLAGDARLRVAQHAIRQSIAARRRPL